MKKEISRDLNPHEKKFVLSPMFKEDTLIKKISKISAPDDSILDNLKIESKHKSYESNSSEPNL